MFYDRNEAVCNDSDMYLDPDSILVIAIEFFDMEMLLDPLEKIMISFS